MPENLNADGLGFTRTTFGNAGSASNPITAWPSDVANAATVRMREESGTWYAYGRSPNGSALASGTNPAQVFNDALATFAVDTPVHFDIAGGMFEAGETQTINYATKDIPVGCLIDRDNVTVDCNDTQMVVDQSNPCWIFWCSSLADVALDTPQEGDRVQNIHVRGGIFDGRDGDGGAFLWTEANDGSFCPQIVKSWVSDTGTGYNDDVPVKTQHHGDNITFGSGVYICNTTGPNAYLKNDGGKGVVIGSDVTFRPVGPNVPNNLFRQNINNDFNRPPEGVEFHATVDYRDTASGGIEFAGGIGTHINPTIINSRDEKAVSAVTFGTVADNDGSPVRLSGYYHNAGVQVNINDTLEHLQIDDVHVEKTATGSLNWLDCIDGTIEKISVGNLSYHNNTEYGSAADTGRIIRERSTVTVNKCDLSGPINCHDIGAVIQYDTQAFLDNTHFGDIDIDGVDAELDTSFEGAGIGEEEGTATVSSAGSSVTVTTQMTPDITTINTSIDVTPLSDPGSRVWVDKTTGGANEFSIELASSPATDVDFHYHVKHRPSWMRS